MKVSDTPVTLSKTTIIRVLVTGSRSWVDEKFIDETFASISAEYSSGVRFVLVSGHCPAGADALAERACAGLGWTLELVPAEWDKYGRRAGFLRNKVMVDSAPDRVVAFVMDESKGASMTVRLARDASLPVQVYSRRTVTGDDTKTVCYGFGDDEASSSALPLF